MGWDRKELPTFGKQCLAKPFTGRKSYDQIFQYLQIYGGLFDDETTIAKAAENGQPILVDRLIRLTDMAAKMQGNSDASYTCPQCRCG